MRRVFSRCLILFWQMSKTSAKMKTYKCQTNTHLIRTTFRYCARFAFFYFISKKKFVHTKNYKKDCDLKKSFIAIFMRKIISC